MIKITADTKAAEAMVIRIRDGLTPANIDPVVDKISLITFGSLVRATPKRWFGQLRAGWEITKPELGTRIIDIPAGKTTAGGTQIRDIAHWVNEGTANNGSGLIFPVRAKRLYIPLKRRAAGGWHEGLVYGVDYILKLFVRGIRGRHFIEPEREKAFKGLREGLRSYIVGLVRGKKP